MAYPKIDSFLSLMYPGEAEKWIEHLSPVGAAEKYVTGDTIGSLPSYLTKDVSLQSLGDFRY